MGRIRIKTKKYRPERVKRSRWHTVSKELMSFYNSKQWRQTRERKLAMNPFCEHCEENNMVSPAYYIDHIKSAIDHPGLRLSFNNLQSLCVSCNASKTAKQSKYKEQ